MSLVYYTDEKNNKLLPQWVAVADEDSLKAYEKSHPNREDVRNAIAIVRQLPIYDIKNKNYNIEFYPRNWTCSYDKNLYIVLNTARPSVYLHLSDLKIAQKDLDAGLPTKEFISAIELLLSLNKNGVGSDVSNWKKLRHNIDSGVYKLNEFSPTEAFTSSSSYALFCRYDDKSEGYLTEKGLGPLSRAITYDSLEEMEAAFNRQSHFKSYEYLQIVKIKSEVESLGELKKMPRYSPPYWGGKTDFTGASIYQIANDVQRNNIEKALKQASEQQIIDAYNALINKGGSTDDEPKKRRM